MAKNHKGLELDDRDWGGKRDDRKTWPKMKAVPGERFRSRIRKEWEDIFDWADTCCLPILSHAELELKAYEQRAAVSLSKSPAVYLNQDKWRITTLARGEGG